MRKTKKPFDGKDVWELTPLEREFLILKELKAIDKRKFEREREKREQADGQ